MSEVSSTRLYLGNLPRNATKQDIEEHFSTHGTGKITEIKLMNGFGFIEYEDAMDARDIVPAFRTMHSSHDFQISPSTLTPGTDGSDFKGERLTVQFARGPRHKENFSGPPDRNAPPRPRRTIYRMQITGLPTDTSWQDLKDFARQAQVDVVYSETGRDRDGKGFVEFENGADLKTAVEKLDKREFKGATVHCSQDIQDERPADKNYRQRSPPRGRYGAPSADDYYSRGPPRGYSPRGYNRERSPRGRPDDYYSRGDYGRRTPPRDPYGPPMPPRREPYGYDPYDRGGPPPPRGYGADPYARNGDPYTGRPRTPPRGAYGGGYAAYERYW